MIGPRQFLLGGIALFALTGSAVAADVPVKGPVYTKAPAAWSWEGQYIGVHGGYAWGDFTLVGGGVFIDSNLNGGFGGVQFGYLHHLSRNWLIGYEVDVSFGDLNGLVGGNTIEMRYFGTARTRLGYAQGPWLFYGTAGLAWAQLDLIGAGPLERAQIGYAVGAGIEYAFSRNWSARVEYLYIGFGDTDSNLIGAPIGTELSMSQLRLALNYRFANWAAAPAQTIYPTKAPVRTTGWTGPYIGIHGGYGWSDYVFTVGGAPLATLDPTGGVFGIQSGYNWQLSRNWVFGIEADSSWGSIEQTAGLNSADIDAMGTVRARLGYAHGNLLTYATGGLAWIHADTRSAVTIRDQFYLGWTAGVGLEYAFSPRWSAKVEYLYSEYSSSDLVLGNLREDFDLHTIKVGLNYRAGIFDLIGMRW
jgi:outer membrane immunogenic protein